MAFGYQVLGFGSGGGPGTYEVQFLVLAGGGAGKNYYGSGGGGAGGYREIASKTFEVQIGDSYTVTVGAGGPNAPPHSPPHPVNDAARAGADSVFGTITSAGGATGGAYSRNPGLDGGSGGGG